jgi:hypothetical protein
MFSPVFCFSIIFQDDKLNEVVSLIAGIPPIPLFGLIVVRAYIPCEGWDGGPVYERNRLVFPLRKGGKGEAKGGGVLCLAKGQFRRLMTQSLEYELGQYDQPLKKSFLSQLSPAVYFYFSSCF